MCKTEYSKVLNSVIIFNSDEFGKNCSEYYNFLDEDNEMYVEYNGKTVDHYNCDYFKFRGKGDEMKDEYSVCVTPLYFVDLDCTVKINIKTSIRGVSKHVCTYMYHTIKIYFRLNLRYL